MANTMARQVKLFLIRHGETVDNVAQLYAGSRDSALTNHGYQQATRLGLHFRTLGLSFTHIFSSHLQRAAKTAGLVRDGQAAATDSAPTQTTPHVVQLPVLMEQDFGFYEGKKWHERPADPNEHKQIEGFVDIETKESLAKRADTFLDGHLLPLLRESVETPEPVVAVVSHGLMLSTLWRRLLLRLPSKSVSLSPELAATGRVSLEHLGGWSNTGYLELHMTQRPHADPSETPDKTVAPAATPCESQPTVAATELGAESSVEAQASTFSTAAAAMELPVVNNPSAAIADQQSLRVADDWLTAIQTINGQDHVKGLKRTGGGVGSSRHDAAQKSIDGFFKRRKFE